MTDNQFYHDDSDGDAAELSFEHYMNVRAFLQQNFGGSLGSQIYQALRRVSRKVARTHAQQNDYPEDAAGIPAIIFKGKGGYFASITMSENTDNDEEEDYSYEVD